MHTVHVRRAVAAPIDEVFDWVVDGRNWGKVQALSTIPPAQHDGGSMILREIPGGTEVLCSSKLRSEKPVPGRVTDTALWPRHRLGISDDSADRRAGARPRSRDPVNASSWKARGPKAIRHSDVLPAAPGRLCGRPWGSLKVSPPRPMRNRFGGNRTVANRPQEPCIRSRWFSIPCWPAGRSGVDPLGNEPIQSSRGASLSSSQLVQPPAFCR